LELLNTIDLKGDKALPRSTARTEMFGSSSSLFHGALFATIPQTAFAFQGMPACIPFGDLRGKPILYIARWLSFDDGFTMSKSPFEVASKHNLTPRHSD
jgi:hypothetical protein